MYSQKRSRATFENDGPPQHAPYAVYGTPLPAFDPEMRDDGSYVPIWKQEVTDERGRKRLHGAFTGGFSAGYFNTVGSKDGWTPSTFVSSRTNRAKVDQQRKAEDFMDDEDLAEQAESQKLLTQEKFAGLGVAGPDDGSRGMFSDLFRTTGETMGVRLLQRMGWRQGQGIGQKVRRRAMGDQTGEDHLFAPEDSRMISFNRKNDRKGLGFAGMATLTQPKSDVQRDDDEDEADARIFSSRRSKLLGKPKKVKQSSFGVGVLNDTGSDDEDPYAIGPQIKYNRIIGGDKTKKGGVISSNVVRPGNTSQKLAQRSINTTTGFRKCHDGRLPLEGFILSTKLVLMSDENQYPPPVVPAEWRPSGLSGNTTASIAFQSTADAAKSSTLDAKARAALLGEQQLPGKSVFDFLKPAARDKLAAASGKDNLPPARGEALPDKHVEDNWSAIPRLDRETAIAALQRGSKGWMPYSEDESKRARYKAFITVQAGLTSSLPERPENLTHDEWLKEMQEFAQAAEVFKPISGLMASRFTTSSASPQMASDQPDAAPLPAQVKDPADEAAAAGMYGPLTRSRLPFHPTRLLCKRFNVKPPANVEVDAEGEEQSGTADLVNKATINRMMMHASFRTPTFSSGGIEGGEQHVNVRHSVQVDASVNDALEQSRADESMLKSIFEDG